MLYLYKTKQKITKFTALVAICKLQNSHQVAYLAALFTIEQLQEVCQQRRHYVGVLAAGDITPAAGNNYLISPTAKTGSFK